MYRFCFLLLFVSVVSLGQSVEKEFFTERDEKTDVTSAHYYLAGKKKIFIRGIDTVESYVDTVLSYYTKDNGRKSKKVYNQEGFLQGQYSEFYENGKLKEKGSYFRDRKIGYIIRWYPDGRPQSTLQYFDEKGKISDWEALDFKIINYWDSMGTQVVNNGNGHCRCYLLQEVERPVLEKGRVRGGLRDSVWLSIFADTVLYKEVYKDGVLETGVRYDKGVESAYDKFTMIPAYEGGLYDLMHYIGSNLRYPPDARKRRIQGQVFVTFVVYEDGTPHEFEIHTGVAHDLDQEALRVLSGTRKWIPGKLRGKPARLRMTLPIRFKLVGYPY